jgi:hypothetical protein
MSILGFSTSFTASSALKISWDHLFGVLLALLTVVESRAQEAAVHSLFHQKEELQPGLFSIGNRQSHEEIAAFNSLSNTNASGFFHDDEKDSTSGNDYLSQFHLGVGLQTVVQFSPVDYPYKLNQMGQFNMGLNYWHGYLKINLSFASLEKFGNLPDCRMLDYALAYEYHQKVYKDLSLFIAPQMGYNTIQFEYSDYSPGRLIETETSAAVSFGMQQVWRDQLGISLVYRRYLVWATPRNVFSTIDLGVSYFFRPNKKLQKWLS